MAKREYEPSWLDWPLFYIPLIFSFMILFATLVSDSMNAGTWLINGLVALIFALMFYWRWVYHGKFVRQKRFAPMIINLIAMIMIAIVILQAVIEFIASF